VRRSQKQLSLGLCSQFAVGFVSPSQRGTQPHCLARIFFVILLAAVVIHNTLI